MKKSLWYKYKVWKHSRRAKYIKLLYGIFPVKVSCFDISRTKGSKRDNVYIMIEINNPEKLMERLCGFWFFIPKLFCKEANGKFYRYGFHPDKGYEGYVVSIIKMTKLKLQKIRK